VTTLSTSLARQPQITTGDDVATALHVAIIMDGNGRWAQKRGLPRTMGHYYGAEAARKVVRAAGELGVTHLTLFGFSSENWRRPKPEIDYLMSLLRGYLRKDVASLHENRVRLKVIGDRAGLPVDIVTLIGEAEAMTDGNAGLNLTIALNYGGRADIAAGVRRLAQDVAAGRLDPDMIDEARVGAALPSADLPDPDLLIRTSGEQRVSNFLLWQLAYTEMLFVERYWPDFSGEDLKAALADFSHRDRRFGGAVSR
jgi:undecaprenyl diphosphate synthase